MVTADHGFATKSLESKTSAAARFSYRDVVPGFMPRGFLPSLMLFLARKRK